MVSRKRFRPAMIYEWSRDEYNRCYEVARNRELWNAQHMPENYSPELTRDRYLKGILGELVYGGCFGLEVDYTWRITDKEIEERGYDFVHLGMRVDVKAVDNRKLNLVVPAITAERDHCDVYALVELRMKEHHGKVVGYVSHHRFMDQASYHTAKKDYLLLKRGKLSEYSIKAICPDGAVHGSHTRDL